MNRYPSVLAAGLYLTTLGFGAGCAGGPQTAPPTGMIQFHNPVQSPSNPLVGVYVSEFDGSQLLNYDYAATGNPLCATGTVKAVNSIQSDVKHELIVPSEDSSSPGGIVYVYKEHAHLCLSNLPSKSFVEPYAAPSDGFSLNGTTYYIANHGGIAVCKATGCIRELTNTHGSNDVVAVTADSTGVYGVTYNGSAEQYLLIYWKNAKGHGTLLAQLSGPGGIYFDGEHNLVSLGYSNSLYVYSGCPSACTPHGPFALADVAIYGTLANGDSEFMTVSDDGVIDVYQYNGINGVSFLYNNSDGLSPSLVPIGIAQRL
jgi:hypothetical protein